jgi:hypothetical protein
LFGVVAAAWPPQLGLCFPSGRLKSPPRACVRQRCRAACQRSASPNQNALSRTSRAAAARRRISLALRRNRSTPNRFLPTNAHRPFLQSELYLVFVAKQSNLLLLEINAANFVLAPDRHVPLQGSELNRDDLREPCRPPPRLPCVWPPPVRPQQFYDI